MSINEGMGDRCREGISFPWTPSAFVKQVFPAHLGPRPEVDKDKVCKIALADKSPVCDPETAGHGVTHLVSEFFEADPALPDIAQHQEQGMLDQRDARGDQFIPGSPFRFQQITFRGSGIAFFFQGMGGMIGRNQIQPVIKQGFPERRTVRRRFDGGIAFDQVAQARIVIAGKVQVVDTDFRRNPFLVKGNHIGEQLHFFFCGEMEYMQSAIIFFGKLYGLQGGFEAGICIPDARVVGSPERNPGLFGVLQVPADHPFILAMGGNQELGFAKQGIQREIIVNQEISRRGPHEYFDPAYLVFFGIRPEHFPGIIIRSPHVEGIIGQGAGCGDLVFFFQQLLGKCGGLGIGHLHKRRGSPGDGSPGFRIDGAFMGEARFPEMNLVINDAGQEMKAFAVDFPGGKARLNLPPYFFDPSVFDQHITRKYRSFIDHRYIFYQVILHNLTFIFSELLRGEAVNQFQNMTQFIKTLVRQFIIFFFPVLAFSQSSFLPEGSKSDHFLERMEILLQTNPELNIFTPKPFSRKMAVKVAEMADSLHRAFPYDDFYRLSATDQQSLRELLMNNTEWVSGSRADFQSKHPVWNTFYRTKANFFEVNDKDFFLVIDPVIQETQSLETGNSQRVFLNAKGLTLRGMIAGKLGFSSYLTDNQERGPQYFQDRVAEFSAVPGAGYYKPFKRTAFDYFDNRASIYFNLLKYFDIQFGYDKNFIGNGYRSLFLSDYAAPYLFLKINTRIWRLNYENLFMELISQYEKTTDYYYPRKYAVVHHLSYNVSKWLNFGLYENVVFSRADYFDFSYLNPVIFLVSAQQQNGSPDKTTAGLDFKANIGHATQFYGQLLINEFVLDQVLHYSRGWWGNKQGLQLGFKFINVFNVKNLDFQFETNLVRPFTYSHNDTVASFSHYNQPLAHPLGANFYEFIGIGRYQPSYKWNIETKLIYYKQGLDSSGVDFGSNIFLNYNNRPRDYGFKIGSGIPATCLNFSAAVSYEIKDNLYIDCSALFRNYSVSGINPTSSQSTIFTLGLRMNMFRRQYDY
jgi:hypothetical protein